MALSNESGKDIKINYPGFHQPHIGSGGMSRTQSGATDTGGLDYFLKSDLGINDGPYSTVGQAAPRPPQVSGDVSPPIEPSSADQAVEKSASNGAIPNIPDGMSMEMRG
uniref:Microtubule-associated protein Jupiter n=1 Tax=Heterorhabditis bacteriophora TaxID=37862 RepID=A0A1I7XCB9_HETBA